MAGAPQSNFLAWYSFNKSTFSFNSCKSACFSFSVVGMLFPLFLTACADSFTCVSIPTSSLSVCLSPLAFSAEIKDSTFAISASNSEAFCVISFVFTTTGFSVPSATVPVSLNPLSPLLGIACPFLGFWFLFTFVASDLILFKMKRLLESCLANALTFACVFVSSFKSSFALLTKFLASSMTDFVFLPSVN